MFTIGQFARICNVSVKALRHYEKIGLLKPARVAEENQYRYYSAAQIEQVRTIAFLKNLGTPLKDILQVSGQPDSPEALRQLLVRQRQALLDTMTACNHKLYQLTNWEKNEEAQLMQEMKNLAVYVQDVPALPVRANRIVSTHFPADIQPQFLKLQQDLAANNLMCAGAPIIVYHDKVFNPEKVDFETAVPVTDSAFANQTLPACRAAATTYVGPYDQLCRVYETMFAWINANGYEVCGPIREIYPNDPGCTPPHELVTQVLIPVKKKP